MGKIWFFQMYACHFQCLALSLENDIFTGICYLLNCDDKSFGVIGRRGIKTLSLLPIPVITVAFTTFVPRCGARFCGESGRRHFTNWNGGPAFCRFKSNFDDGRHQRRNPGHSRDHSDHFQRYKNERLKSLENLSVNVKHASVENLHDSEPNSPVVADEVTGKAAEAKTSSSNNSSAQLSEKSAHTPSPEIDNGYASWYNAEEQQQIVNMLKEVNMRHERQLRRNSVLRSERPTSDDSTCSNADRASLSSDDEDDGIVVLVSLEKDGPPPDDPDEEKDIANDYLEKSVSDYFEEFQSIFTVSPEKNIFNSLTKECMKECTKSKEKAEDTVLMVEKESSDQNKQAEDKKGDGSLSAMAETESGIRDVENEIASESDQREATTATGEDKSASLDEPRILFDATPSTSRDSEVQKFNVTSKSIEQAASSVYELNDKHIEGLKTERKVSETSKNIEEAASSVYELNGKSEEAAVLNSVQRNDKPGNICDLCSSRTDITKIVSQLRKKDVTKPLITKPQPLNTTQSRSSYCRPEIVYSFPNQTTVYMQNSWPVDYRIKRNTADYKYKTNRLPQCPSDAISKSVETAFLKKFPCFIRQAVIPERKEAKSEPYLLRRNEIKLQNNIPITSFSDSHLPFKGQNAHYKRITVEELFQTVSQNRKEREVQKFGIKEDLSCELVTASDHLKKILKIGKGNESRIHSPALKNDNKFKDNDQKVGNYRDANVGSQFPYTSLLSGRYTPEGDKCGQKQILQTRDDPGKSTTAKAEQTSTRNNAYDSKPNYGVNSQTKYENAHKNYKQGKSAQFSQRDASSSLPVCGPTKPVNKAKSQNSDIVVCKNHYVDTLPKMNSSKEGADQKETMSKPKRRKKLKNDKTKTKNEGETVGKAVVVTSVCSDKTDINQELRTGSDCGKYREKFDRAVPIKNSACTDEDKHCNSWKNRKRADSFVSSKKESSKFSETDSQSSNDLKTQISQQPSESCLKQNRQSKVKASTSRKNNSSFSKSCVSHEISKESISSASKGLKNENLRQTENNSAIKKTAEKGNSNVADLNILKLKTDEDDRHSGAESKNLKVRDSTHSRENLHSAPTPSNRKESPSKLRQKRAPKSLVSCKNVSDREHLERDRSESPSKLRQKCARAPRNFVSRKKFSDGEHLERDLAVKTGRNCDKLVRNYSETYEKASCSGKGNYFPTSNSFGPRKNSFKTKNKVSSPSGTVPSHTTDIKEKFVLESIYCYSKPSKIDDKNSVISETNTTNVRKEEKRKHLTGEVKTFSDEGKQNSLICELGDDAMQERSTGDAKESNNSQSMCAAPNLKNLQNLNYSARMNICTRSFVSSTASKESQNIKIEDIGNKKFSDYDYPSKECEISGGNQICCFHAVDENIQKYLHSAQKLNKDIDHFVEDPGMPSESTSANSCSVNSICRQTEREKEGNGTKVARKTTGEDFTPMDKNDSGSADGAGRQTEREKEGNGTKVARKTTGEDFTPMDKNDSGSDDGVCADGIRALCLRSEDSCFESLADKSGKYSVVCQPPCYSAKDFPEKESVSDSDGQKRNHRIDSDQPTEDFIPKLSALTLGHLSQPNEIKSKCGDQIFKNASKDEDLFMRITSQEITKRVNCKQDIDSKVTSDVLGLPGTVLRKIHVPVSGGRLSCEMMSDASVRGEEYQVSNSLARKASELLHCIASLNGAGASVRPESDKAKTCESPEEKSQLLALNEETLPASQVSPIQTIVSSCNSDAESIGKSEKEKIGSESDLNHDPIVLLSDVVQVSKVLITDRSLPQTNDIFNST
ncbi:hypothetical protein AVEN_226150-1 [Araneus ventricosus]|uniref:Uncharacterized protein n=1 Tax=Araneus ventricosus TaxID=182803 RepID=A0A4Y2LZS0_ARAVE|nr:hypothetical protein AVEN_226150-1 [Araneus ventricosus]